MLSAYVFVMNLLRAHFRPKLREKLGRPTGSHTSRRTAWGAGKRGARKGIFADLLGRFWLKFSVRPSRLTIFPEAFRTERQVGGIFFPYNECESTRWRHFCSAGNETSREWDKQRMSLVCPLGNSARGAGMARFHPDHRALPKPGARSAFQGRHSPGHS